MPRIGHLTQVLPAIILLTLSGYHTFSADSEKIQVKPVVYTSHVGRRSNHMNLGPTGAKAWIQGYNLVVISIDHGSPADGTLQLTDVIIAADGLEFGPDHDPRITLGNAIGRAEADGKPLHLTVLRKKQRTGIELPLPQLGAFSPTWPANCEKSERILNAACHNVLKYQLADGMTITYGNMGTYLGGLLLLATGEAKYLDAARRAAYATIESGFEKSSWKASYGAILLAEYYLLTGDKSVLQGLKARCDFLTDGNCQFPCGSWGHGAAYGGYGALNQVGLTCAMALVLAEECGVEVNQESKNRALGFFAKYAELGAVPYGDNYPYLNYFDKNGRNATAALLMKFAGRSQESNALASSVAMSYWEREEGHTGGVFGITWGPLATALVDEARFRKFMDYQKWFYNLTRNWRGELVHIPFREALLMQDANIYVRHGGPLTTAGFGLVYTLPRKKLRITGAPSSVFAVSSKLPEPLNHVRELYLARDWSACDKSLADIDETKFADQEERYWLRQLRDARKLTQASTERLLIEMESNMMEDSAYRAWHQFEALKRAVGELSDPRLEPIAKRLKTHEYDVACGKTFNQEWQHFLERYTQDWYAPVRKLRKAAPEMPSLQKPVWEALSSISDIEPQTWRTLLPENLEDLPQKWYAPDFDDSQWTKGEGIQTWFMIPGGEERTKSKMGSRNYKERPFAHLPIVARRVFNVEDPKGLALKLRLRTVRVSLTKVYLNGSLIASVPRGGGSHTNYASIPISSSAFSVLRKGQNLLAVSSDCQGPGVNSLDVGLFINREPMDTRTVTTSHADFLDIADIDGGGVLRIHEPMKAEEAALKASVNAKETSELVKELGSPVGAYRTMVEEALISRGLEGMVAVSQLSQDKGWKQRSAYCEITGRVALKSSSTKKNNNQVELSQSEKDAIAKQVKNEIPKLIKLLDDGNHWVRRRAVWALGQSGESAKVALPKILKMIEDPDEWVRLAVIPTARRLNSKPEDLFATAVKALKQPDTAWYVTTQSKKVLVEYPEFTDGKLDGLITFLRNLPHGFCGKALTRPIMEMAVSLDPNGETMVPVLAEGIIGEPGFGHQRGPARKVGIEVLTSYGEKAKLAVPIFEAFLAEQNNENRHLRKHAIQALKALGKDTSAYERPGLTK